MSRPKYRRPKVAQEIGFQCKHPSGKAKSAYRSAAKARQAIRANMSRNAPLYVYQCPRCNYWHLTSKPQDA
jgi:hypothetical protein